MEPSEQLFRHEFGRMVAALTRIFGVHNVALAEDVAQEAFCRALEIWRFRGMPEKPAAWLMTTAKNRAYDQIRHRRTEQIYAPHLEHLLKNEWTLVPAVEEIFSENEIKDDLLRMMYSCCQPRLPEEAQIALILNILCGFSVAEVAGGLLSPNEAMKKRILRAKKALAGSKRLFDLTVASDIAERLPVVQRALYLLFNEGYHGTSSETVIREELCREAMRLTALLLEDEPSCTPSTCALSALMCLNAARLPSRIDPDGNLSSLFHQDRSRWDQNLVAEGLELLERSAIGDDLTEYHLEAAIAAVHARASSMQDTDWSAIVSFYDRLFEMRPSPVIALNRAIAIAQLHGPDHGLEEIHGIANKERLSEYPFYPAALGELELRRGRHAVASEYFKAALSLTRNRMEHQFIERRLQACEKVR